MKPRHKLTAPREFSWRLLLAGTLWLLVVITGLAALSRYEHTPGTAGEAPARWPKPAGIQLAHDRPTLVMFAHPRCPCTRASMGELAILMARCQGQADARVCFFKPAGATDQWAQTGLWRAAAAIPGVQVQTDENGVEAGRFHIQTSGHVVLYSSHGQLLFSGGITSERGHSGDNPGRAALTEWLGGAPAPGRVDVFGCSLLEPDSVCKTPPPMPSR